jgi:alkaline phosphatase D
VKHLFTLCALIVLVAGCKTPRNATPASPDNEQENFLIAFGSCNRNDLPNELWDDILAEKPDLWIWGGDNVYADTDNMDKLKAEYELLSANPGYAALKKTVPVLGTWDDHDYGLNDGGREFQAREQSKQVFLDFFEVSAESLRRNRPGVYYSQIFTRGRHSVKVIVLDTRYQRSGLRKDPSGVKRYLPNPDPDATLLGESQWQWLEAELGKGRADFTIIVSSIQLLSGEHGFESWLNFPMERDRFLALLEKVQLPGVIVLSGDRHISEFSKYPSEKLGYPLIDFTSSGLTHVYDSFSGEPNPFRVGGVISEVSFGALRLNLKTRQAQFEIIGDGGVVLERLSEQY